MTNPVAFTIAALFLVFMGLDFTLNGGEYMLYLARKFLQLVDWVEFWR